MTPIVIPVLLWAAGAAQPQASCPEFARAAATADRLAELPPEIRERLLRLLNNDIGDRGSPLLQTDAPSAAERGYPRTRFVRGLRFRDMWLVQYEVSMMSGVHTLSFVFGDGGRFHLSRRHFFGGPACESVRAALNGVTTPGGL